MVRSISLAALALLLALSGAVHAESREHWISTWATAQQLSPNVAPAGLRPPSGSEAPRSPSPIPLTPPSLKNQTVRMVARVSVGGSQVRVQISNAQGHKPLRVGAAHIATHNSGSTIVAGSDRTLTFGGRAEFTVPSGAIIASDPVSLRVADRTDLAVSLYLPEDTGPVTLHPLGLRTTYIAEGNVASSETLTGASQNRSYFWLSGVEVLAPANTATVVAFGDSITDGFATTPDANLAWPTLLAQRFLERRGPKVSVLNLGISGNRVLRDGAGTSALARFDRDVLSRPGVRWIILLEGINDISFSSIPGMPATEQVDSAELIAGLRLFVDKAHLHGIRVMGGTIMPYEGVATYAPKGEAIRQAVNDWIRTSAVFDSVVDFDAVMRDPQRPTRLRSEFDSGDHVHPNDAGNRAMAAAIDLSRFERR